MRYLFLFMIILKCSNLLAMDMERLKIFSNCQVAAHMASADSQIRGNYNQTQFWDKYANKVSNKFYGEIDGLDFSKQKFWITMYNDFNQSQLNQYTTMGEYGMRFAANTLGSSDCVGLSK